MWVVHAELPGIRRISLLYCYPSYFSDELIDAIANIDKVHSSPLAAVSPLRPRSLSHASA